MSCSCCGVEDFAGARRAPDFLGQRQRRAAVAVGHAHQRRRAPRHRAAALALDLLRRARSIFSIASASSDWNTSTRARDSSARVELEGRIFRRRADQHDGAVFHHRQERSCCARLKRWISSTNSSVPLPDLAPRARRLEHLLQVGDAGEHRGNLLEMRARSHRASSRATVVLPVPGGPQKIIEPSERVSSMRVSAPSGPSR